MRNRRRGDAGSPEAAGRRAADIRRELLSRVAGQVGDGVAVFDTDDRLLYANPALAELRGLPAEHLVGMDLSAFVDLVELAWERQVTAAWGERITRAEMTSRRPDGSRLCLEVTLSSLLDDFRSRIGTIVCFHDVTDRNVLEERLKRAALHDPLTDLPNRRLFSDRLDHSIAVARRTFSAVAVLFIDLDGFKRVNDTFGHGVGDQLLIHTASRFRACLRSADTLARLGGDEFVVVVEGVTDPAEPARTAERLLAAMEQPFDLGDITVEMTASIGIAFSTSEAQRSLLHAADSAMYEAKSAGPGQIVVRDWAGRHHLDEAAVKPVISGTGPT